MEHKARRSYPKVWAEIADKNTNCFYHQGEIDSQLLGQLKLQGLCPIRHNNEGESRFVSPEMYKNLLALCRCGRSRQGAHMGKCLQRTLSPDYTRTETHGKTQKVADQRGGDDGSPTEQNVPRTSNSSIGFLAFATNYRKLERSMQYVSPAYSMAGPRISAVPYNNIIIG
ncbi:uncharacterized protein LOC110178790 [Drosophila serrata]|uniref:uncharacterized protein LOC110178790 n=1 Tax=Drosophila serrata TaxID=7274 RepID=UPI000A1D0BBB|nr:uncharacterized protein LOC110178790 [Drosophila serrata]